MFQIYFDNKQLILCEKANAPEDRATSAAEISLKSTPGENRLKEALAALKTATVTTVIVETESPAAMLEELKAQFLVIQAGGGFVYTESGKLLFIFRRGKWDLPKGKLDEGETLEQCSLREVEEETGLSGLTLEAPLCITYHTYPENDKTILKESHWYLMRSSGEVSLTPQEDEGIERCEWVPFVAVSECLSNTHASIKDVVEAGLEHVTV